MVAESLRVLKKYLYSSLGHLGYKILLILSNFAIAIEPDKKEKQWSQSYHMCRIHHTLSIFCIHFVSRSFQQKEGGRDYHKLKENFWVGGRKVELLRYFINLQFDIVRFVMFLSKS